jgi:hypothetical protein
MKDRRSKLDPFQADLDQWLGVENVTLAEVAERLKLKGLDASLSRISVWWEARQQELRNEAMLDRLSAGNHFQRELKATLEENPPPDVAQLAALFRQIVSELTVYKDVDGKKLKTANELFKSVLESHKVEQSGQALAQAERKLKILEDQVAETKAKIQAEIEGAKAGGLKPETLERIERELGLLH